MHPGRALGIGLDDIEGNVVSPQLRHQARRDGIPGADDHMPRDIRRRFPWSAHTQPRLQPGRVEKTNEQKRHHDQQQHDSRKQHNQAEESAKIALKGDVAEAQRAHHRQRPVQPRDPRVLALLHNHQRMEQYRVEGDDRQQQREEAKQRKQIAPRFALRHQGGQLGAQDFHTRKSSSRSARIKVPESPALFQIHIADSDANLRKTNRGIRFAIYIAPRLRRASAIRADSIPGFLHGAMQRAAWRTIAPACMRLGRKTKRRRERQDADKGFACKKPRAAA
ncbi:MAG: hypothetical protein BWZ10_03274 [candidate division BRC1 bacterium ADurb.BinA364]|nr:MAG: hypothetical protein BWZ10_03274 [candidate division BRC1 bacterium ADurb.BinA364]